TSAADRPLAIQSALCNSPKPLEDDDAFLDEGRRVRNGLRGDGGVRTAAGREKSRGRQEGRRYGTKKRRSDGERARGHGEGPLGPGRHRPEPEAGRSGQLPRSAGRVRRFERLGKREGDR